MSPNKLYITFKFPCLFKFGDSIENLKMVMVVSVLVKIKYACAQISVLNIAIPMSKTACINSCHPWWIFPPVWETRYIVKTHRGTVWHVLTICKSSHANVSFRYSPKTSESQIISDLFREYGSGTLSLNGVNHFWFWTLSMFVTH